MQLSEGIFINLISNTGKKEYSSGRKISFGACPMKLV